MCIIEFWDSMISVRENIGSFLSFLLFSAVIPLGNPALMSTMMSWFLNTAFCGAFAVYPLTRGTSPSYPNFSLMAVVFFCGRLHTCV